MFLKHNTQSINPKLKRLINLTMLKNFLKTPLYVIDTNKVKNTNFRLGEDIWHAHNQERIWPRIYKQLQRKRSDNMNEQSSNGHPVASKPKKTSSSLLVSNVM